MNIQWDAENYGKKFGFVHEYGNDVLELLNLQKGQTVIDLGCGNGALSKKMADMGVNVIGIDASEELLAAAKKSYPEIEFRKGNAVSFTVEEKVDAVFSNAVFHWIDRELQPSLLKSVASALKKGGTFAFEFGGYGNARKIHGALARAFERRGLSYGSFFYFPSIGQYAPLLEQAGFTVRYGVLFDRLTPLTGKNGLSDWIHMFVKQVFEGMEVNTKEEIINEAVEELKEKLYIDGVWYADYVRIRFQAVLE